MNSPRVLSVQVGRPRTVAWQGRKIRTAIFKSAVVGRVPTVGHNLAGDKQADSRVHGGEYKAIYAYPSEHYGFWQERLGRDLAPGSFGENLTTSALIESAVAPGDVFQIGSLQLTAATPRIPCFKLGIRLERDSIVKEFMDAAKPGIYFRITSQGSVGGGDPVQVVSLSGFPLSILDLMLLYIGMDKDPERLRLASECEHIPPDWRKRFAAAR